MLMVSLPDIHADHPILHNKCADRVMILPHIGSATNEARQAMADVTFDHILQYFGIE